MRVPITQNDHLRNRESSDNVEEILSILRLRKEGKSLREIAKTLEMSLGMVQRRLRTAEVHLPTTLGQNGPAHPDVQLRGGQRNKKIVREYDINNQNVQTKMFQIIM